MPLNTKTFDAIVNDLVTQWSAQVGLSPNLVSGDPLLALMQTVAAQFVYLQALIVQVNSFARASTCVGADLDSWTADFSFPRLPATSGSGVATFGVKIVKATAVNIPVGTIIQTSGAAIQYKVIADTTKSGYSSSLNAYVLTPGSLTVDTTAQALVPGAAYNVASPNQLTQISSTLPGIDTVTNGAAIVNGKDAEPDSAFQSRFKLFINSRANATKAAIQSTIVNLQQGLFYNLLENVDVNNNPLNGNFVTVLDDGSGAPPSSLITQAQAAIDLTRAFTVSEQVIAPVKITPSIILNIRPLPTSSVPTATLQANVVTAIVNFVNNNLTIGQTLYLNKLIQVAIDTDPVNILSVQPSSVTINGLQSDLVATYKQVIKITGVNVTVGTY